jgi:hypothetical protein
MFYRFYLLSFLSISTIHAQECDTQVQSIDPATSLSNNLIVDQKNNIHFEILPFLAEERKKLESIIVKKDSEIIRLMNEVTRLKIELKECNVEYKSCRNETTTQLILGGLATLSSAYAGYKCYDTNANLHK